MHVTEVESLISHIKGTYIEAKDAWPFDLMYRLRKLFTITLFLGLDSFF